MRHKIVKWRPSKETDKALMLRILKWLNIAESYSVTSCECVFCAHVNVLLCHADGFRKDLHHGHWLWRERDGGGEGHHPSGSATALPGHPEAQTRGTERWHSPAGFQSQRPIPGGETTTRLAKLIGCHLGLLMMVIIMIVVELHGKQKMVLDNFHSKTIPRLIQCVTCLKVKCVVSAS